MLRRLRENGPVVLVPAAWVVATAAYLDLVSVRTLLIAHVVMDAVLVAFAVLSWRDMRSGVLLAWKAVLVAGLAVTLAGTAALAADPVDPTLARVAVAGWMLLPAAGLAYTGWSVPRRASWPYAAGGACSAVGFLVYAAASVTSLGTAGVTAGLLLAGVGQTAGIVAAVVQY